MKYTGLGFQLELDSFEILINDEIKVKNNDKIKFNLFSIDDYKLGVASSYNIKSYTEYKIDELY